MNYETTLASVRLLVGRHNAKAKQPPTILQSDQVQDLTGGWRANKYTLWILSGKKGEKPE